MGITHDSLAVQAFRKVHGRTPRRSLDVHSPDEAWIQTWKAECVARLIRDPEYAQDWARRHAWRTRT